MKALRGLLLSSFTALAIVACGGGSDSSKPSSSSPPPTADKIADLPESTLSQMNKLLAEKEARTPAQRKISSQLLYAKSGKFPQMKQNLKLGEPAKPGEMVSHLRYDDQGRVLSDLKGDANGGLQAQIELAGGTVVSSSAAHNSARAWLPMASLESLASQSVVRSIRPALAAATTHADAPYKSGKYAPHLSYEQRVANVQAALKERAEAIAMAKANGTVKLMADTTQPATNVGAALSGGDHAHGADAARKFYGVDGTGVNVGVLSDSDDFSEDAIMSGDLPADQFTIPGQSGRPGSGEGTAMMEIVHDVAPGAKIFFGSAFESPEAFADNIRQLRFTYHCDVIIDDVIYYFESPYEDDIVAAAVEDVVADGATYYSSAGNEGNFDDGTSGTWEGDFKSGGTLSTLPSGYKVLDFGNKVISNRVEVAGDPIYLHWSDPGSLDNPSPAATNDYDLFILSEDLRTVLAASTDIQDGTDIPFEFIDATIPVNARVVVAQKAGAAARAIHLQIAGGELGISTSGAVYGHAAAKHAFAVAAVDAAEAAGGVFTGGPTTPVELYSSDGNRDVDWDRNNNLIGHGQPLLNGSAGELRQKPEVTAADGVATTLPGTSGLNPFFGTSAAAPHAGAIAALIKSALPNLANNDIYLALQQGSNDIEAVDLDRDSGAGIIDAGKALKKAGAKAAVFLEQGTVVVTPSSGAGVNPGSGGSMSVQVVNNGGQNASAVKATLTSSTPGVTIVNGLSNYPNIASLGAQQNTTPFTFSVDASVPCGSRLIFNLSVTYTGRGPNPVNFSIPVLVGTASTTAIKTIYTGGRVAIPDGNATGVNIPITLTNIGVISSLKFNIDGATCTATQGATTVGLDHSWVGDLTLTLTSPSGTKITLMDRPGGINNSGNNFCKTVLADDATNSIQNIAIAGAPWQGSFKPAQALAAFGGENANGTWILHATDSVTIDTGSVRAFSVDTTGFVCTP